MNELEITVEPYAVFHSKHPNRTEAFHGIIQQIKRFLQSKLPPTNCQIPMPPVKPPLKETANSHFYLYAKGHYDYKDKQKLNDLIVILSEYTGCGIEHLTLNNVLSKLVEICEPYIVNKCEGWNLARFIEKINPNQFLFESKGFIEDCISACLSVLACQSVSDIEKYDGKLAEKSESLAKKIIKNRIPLRKQS